MDQQQQPTQSDYRHLERLLNQLSPDHFLSLPRPDPNTATPIQPILLSTTTTTNTTTTTTTTAAAAAAGSTVDTTTLAAHDFDVDNRTGFMPPHPPLRRLPSLWEPWERVLEDAQRARLCHGERIASMADDGGTNDAAAEMEKAKGEKWRESVREIPNLPTEPLHQSELYLRRAHHVLTWILHFYVHSIPIDETEENNHQTGITTTTTTIPRTLSLPLLRVCAQLQLPPVLTFSDTVLYNWDFADQDPNQKKNREEEDEDRRPLTFRTPLKCQTLFTGTQTEQEFFLLSARIELRGVRALDLMRATMDEAFVGDDIAIRRITGFLGKLKDVVGGMTQELREIRSRGCDPDIFYRELRPWLKGVHPGAGERWIFEGLDKEEEEEEGRGHGEPVCDRQPDELSGPSAGQSSIVHALDIFLGVDKWSHMVVPFNVDSTSSTAHASSDGASSPPSFLTRMRQYIPRHHRAFLQHLSANPRPLRELVVASGNGELVEAYNGAVGALKEFRDAHMVVVALYILGPARKVQREGRVKDEGEGERGEEFLRGTGGTDVVRFLKSVRDQTLSATVLT